MKFAVACALALTFVAPVAAASSVDVDTIYAKSAENEWLFSGFGRGSWISQSFTPGVSGTLDRIDLQIFRMQSDDLRFRIGSGEAIAGNYVELLILDVPAANVSSTMGGAFSLDLSSHGLALKKGNIYSVILSSTRTGNGAGFGWVIGEEMADGTQISAPPYEGGRAFASVDQGVSWQTRGVDRPLRTWMTQAVPEPASWAMMIAGFGLAGAAVRRKRAALA